MEKRAKLLMWNWHETETRKAAEPRAKALATPSTVIIAKQPGGVGRAGEAGREEGDIGGGGGRGARHPQEPEVWVWPSSSLKLWAFK